MNTPIDPLCLRKTEAGLCSLLPGEGGESDPELERQLAQYFAGERRSFALPLRPVGSAFQLAVWAAMCRIPYGRVVSYGQLAAALGRPRACRAVAQAVAHNPLLLLQPCHRVVAAEGLGGFRAGVEKKRLLLRMEGIEITEKTGISEKFFFTFP